MCYTVIKKNGKMFHVKQWRKKASFYIIVVNFRKTRRERTSHYKIIDKYFFVVSEFEYYIILM